MHTRLTVRDLLQKEILSCSPDASLAAAAQQMAAARCGSILVVEAGEVVGIWTEYDALKLDFAEPMLAEMPIAGFMSSPVVTIDVDTPTNEAAVRFRDMDIRHLLAIDAAGNPQGIVSQSDVVLNQGIEYFISMREVGAVFNQQAVVVDGATSVPDAVEVMRKSQAEAVIVHSAAGDYGILTERDVVRLVGVDCSTALLQDVASFPLLTLSINATLYQARKLFMENRVRHLGVTGDDEELIGLVSFSDILAHIEHEYIRHLREALQESEASLALSNRRLRSAAKAFETTLEGIMVTDAEHVIESVNPAFSAITGYSAGEVIGKRPSILSSGSHDGAFYYAMKLALATEGHWQGEICNRRKDGEVYFLWLTIDAVKDDAGRLTNYVGVFSDFTIRKAAEEQMRFNALHDPLTGLANRALLLQQLQRAVPHARRHDRKLAVIFIDLDKFKEINDNFGHHAGDQVLLTVAQRLRQGVRSEDTVARFGGDEFVLLIEDLLDNKQISAIVAKLMQRIAEPIPIDSTEFQGMASIGVAVYPDHGGEPNQLLHNADVAMYAAKQEGGSNFRFHSAGQAAKEGHRESRL